MTSIRPAASVPQPLVRLSRIALVATALDLATKAVATQLWSVKALHLTNWLSFALIPNHGGAFGLSAGAYTWQLNLALTLAAIVFVVPVARDLSAVDKDAPVALGLIVGGALGNLGSLVLPPAGVADFIAVHWSPTRGLVLNVADLAAYAGLAMIVRTGFRVAGALVAHAKRPQERVGSLYVHKTDAKRALRKVRIERAPELVVAEWDNVADLGIVRADAPSVEEIPSTPRPGSDRRRHVEPVSEIPVLPPMVDRSRQD